MKQLLSILLGFLFSLTSCEKEEPITGGGIPLHYHHFFQILNPEGGDPFKDWTEEELNAIRIKKIDHHSENRRGETDWLPFSSIIQNDTATIFHTYSLLDTNYVYYPKLNRTDTIVHKTTDAYDKYGNHLRIKVSEFYFNDELEVVLDFESDPELLRSLSKTSKDSLIEETYVMRFTREN